MSCLAFGCLVGALANPLQKLEIWRQVEVGAFGISYEKTFIITESDLNYPYGFDKNKAQKVAQIYKDYKAEKIILLVLATAAAGTALSIGEVVCNSEEVSSEVNRIKTESEKQLKIEQVKQKGALASKAQRQLHFEEMTMLSEMYGSIEGQIQEADELNVLGGEETEEEEEEEQQQQQTEQKFREEFPENTDETYWKAIKKEIEAGVGKHQIIKEVMACSESKIWIGNQYYDFLINKFGEKETHK